MPTWDSSIADALWTTACGKDRWLGTAQNLSEEIRAVTDEQLWQLRTESRAELVAYAREHLALQLKASGASVEDIQVASQLFNRALKALADES